MATVRFISDLHFNHKTIHTKAGKLRGSCANVQEHNNWLIRKINSVQKKNDMLFVLGDIAFDHDGIELVKRINGNKKLVMGNHDDFAIDRYLNVFQKIYGLMKYKGSWLSHAPIAESSLRGKLNIHGHTHSSKMVSDCGRYACVSVEALDGVPIEIKAIKNEIATKTGVIWP